MIPDIIESEKDSNVLCSGNFRIIAQVFASGKTVTVCKKFIVGSPGNPRGGTLSAPVTNMRSWFSVTLFSVSSTTKTASPAAM
jgi:hypothetical protein